MTRTFLNQKHLQCSEDQHHCLYKELSISNMGKYKAASDKVHRVQSNSRRLTGTTYHHRL